MERVIAAPGAQAFKKQSQAKEVWRRFRKSKGAVAGLLMLSVILFLLVFANFIAPYARATG